MSKNKLEKPQIAQMAVSTDEAAIMIGVSKHMLEMSRVTGELCGCEPPSFFRIGRKLIRYRVTDIESWLNERMSYKTLAEENSTNMTA